MEKFPMTTAAICVAAMATGLVAVAQAIISVFIK